MVNNYLKELPKDLKLILIEYLEHPHDVLNLHKVIKLKNKDYKRVICEKYNINLKNFQCKFEFDFKQLYIEVLTDQLVQRVNLLSKIKEINKKFFPNEYIVLFLILNGNIQCNNITESLTDKTDVFKYLFNKCSYKKESSKYYKLYNYTSDVIIPYIKFQLNIKEKKIKKCYNLRDIKKCNDKSGSSSYSSTDDEKCNSYSCSSDSACY